MASRDFIVINMNTGKNKKNNADSRKRAIKDILISPTLVFVQEFTWKNLGSRAFKDMEIPERFSFLGNKDSGFIYDRNCISCERLDLKSSVRRTYGLSVARHSSELNFDLPRLCLCKIKSIRPPEFELLCVCWHGPHIGFSDEKKKSHLRSLLWFLMKIKVECGNLPLLLGGDFNLDSRKVKEVCSEIAPNLVVDSWPNSVMMWVFCSDFASTVKRKSKRLTKSAFDHSVLKLDLCISTITETLKRSIIPIKYRKKPKVDQTESFEYKLYIKKEETEAENRMISVSWHGAYGEYSERAFFESIISTFQLMTEEITSEEEDYDFDFKKLGLKWVLKGEPIMKNIHSHDNTLQTWIFSNKEELLSDVTGENQSVEKVKPVKQTCNRPIANATPVDIHFDIVNWPLVPSGKSYVTVGGFFKRCVDLQVNSLE